MINDLLKLRTYIEENLRSTSISGIPYIDINDNRRTILSRENTVVVGRRGSGKSTLLKEIIKNNQTAILLNMENYKDISFPNIIIYVTRLVFDQLLKNVKAQPIYKHYFKKRKLMKSLRTVIVELDNLYSEDDDLSDKIIAKKNVESGTIRNFSSETSSSSIAMSGNNKNSLEVTKDRDYKFIKLNKFRKQLVYYQTEFKKVVEYCFSEKALFIAIDDLYFIAEEYQSYIVDLFHVLTNELNAYVKIASIKHRSRMYVRDNYSYHGIEIGHDAIEIDLDYSLECIEKINIFYSSLLDAINKYLSNKITIDDIFSGDGYKQLCLASGGVTRDFLRLFLGCLNTIIINQNQKIDKQLINGQASSLITSKLNSIQNEEGAISEKVETLLQYLKNEVYSNKTNCLLIKKDESEKYYEVKQLIKYLYDYRLIHLIDKNTSAALNDGSSYEAYILDVGLYDQERSGSFKQVEPGSKDDMICSPRFTYEKLSGCI